MPGADAVAYVNGNRRKMQDSPIQVCPSCGRTGTKYDRGQWTLNCTTERCHVATFDQRSLLITVSATDDLCPVCGTLGKPEWVFYETPQLKEKISEQESSELKEKVPKPENPILDNPILDNPILENPPLLSIDSVLSTEEQQQEGAKAPAAVSKFPKSKTKPKDEPSLSKPKIYDCLKDDPIPEREKEWLTKNRSEDDVKYAIKWADHPNTKISTTRIQVMKWASQAKPAFIESKEQREESNKDLAKKIQIVEMPKGVYFETLNKYVEIGSSVGGQPIVIPYTEKAFEETLKKTLLKYKIKWG